MSLPSIEHCSTSNVKKSPNWNWGGYLICLLARPELGDQGGEVALGGFHGALVRHAGPRSEPDAPVCHEGGEPVRVAPGAAPEQRVELERRAEMGLHRLAHAQREPVVERAVALRVEEVGVVERAGVGPRLDRAVELLVEREASVVEDRDDALGATPRVLLDGGVEHVLLRVEVVVGETRRNARRPRHRPHRDVIVALLGEEAHRRDEQLPPALIRVLDDSGHSFHLL